MKSWWRKKISNSEVIQALRILSISDLRKISYSSFIQLALSLLDLIGVAIIGILGALAISGVESRHPGTRVSRVLRLFHLQNMSFQNTVAILGITASFILIGRTLASAIITRKTLFFLSRRGTAISTRLVNKVLAQPLIAIRSRTSQETLYALTGGVEAIVLRVIGTSISMFADASLLLVMVAGLFVVDSTMAISTLLVFSLIGFFLYLILHKHAISLGKNNTKLQIQNNEKILEILNSYRESTVRGTKAFYSSEIGKIRSAVNHTSAQISFLPNVSKYIVETAVVLGSLIIAGGQFLLKDAVHAVASLSVYIAAGSRIGPAALRLQQGAIQIKTNMGIANSTLNLIHELESASEISPEILPLDLIHEDFKAEIKISNLSFKYPTREALALTKIELKITEGMLVALVGPSGAGKTTLIDSIMGILTPTDGEISISGFTPHEAVSKWPGAIAYVPQDVSIFNGTVLSNIALGFAPQEVPELQINKSLEVAKLLDFVNSLPQGIHTEVGENGSSFSGGQRQRLGIARALFTNPKLLVLDEATSALDGDTEIQVASAIRGLKGKTTILMIAHRLSAVRDADAVVYMENGKAIAIGSFEEVRLKVPEFDKQATLMGL